ncbi:MAG TPA: hypothetical protein VMU52_02845 [Steroidobacteraceae bacterium]|nr:hypothetical protein [Steroidobacteraceae bacterium]
MRPLICVLAATALLVLQSGCAQQPYRHHGGPPSIDQLATELDLNATQKTQVAQILDDEHAQREQLRSSGAGRDQMQALQSDLISKLSAVLTPDQLQKFEQLEQQGRHHRHGFGGYGGGYGQGPSAE